VATSLQEKYPTGASIGVAFRHRSLLAVYMGSDWKQVSLWPPPVETQNVSWPEHLWLVMRAGTLHSVPRSLWQSMLESDAIALVMFAPHNFSPVELLPLIESPRASDLGLQQAIRYTGSGYGVIAMKRTGENADYSLGPVPLHARADAALFVLENDIASADFLRERPVISGTATQLERVGSALPAEWCLVPTGDPYDTSFMSVVPASLCES
jgi:hypothetical protein